MTLGLAFLLKNLKTFSFFGDFFPPNSVQQTQTLVSTNICVIHAILFLVSVLDSVLAWTSALNWSTKTYVQHFPQLSMTNN